MESSASTPNGRGRDRPIWLITGATGTIGPAIVDEMIASGADVRALTRRRNPMVAAWPWTPAADRIEVLQGDVGDAADLRRALSGVDVVVHAAGSAHRRPASPVAARKLVTTNVAAARNVAEAITRVDTVSRTVFISSAAVYGPGDGSPRDESVTPRPDTAYGRSKLESERVMGDVLGDALTVLRPCAVYGPRLSGQYATLLWAVESRWPVPLFDGHGHCLVTDTDLARAVVAAATAPDACGRTFNVTDGGIYRVGEVVAAIRAATGTTAWRSPVLPARPGSVALSALDPSNGDETTRRARLRLALRSLSSGPALDSSALRKLLTGWPCDDLASGWRRTVIGRRDPRIQGADIT